MGHGDGHRTPLAPQPEERHLGKRRWPRWLPPKALLVVVIVVARPFLREPAPANA